MFIAFEGPDETGKSTSAKALSYNGSPIYNATKQNHKAVGLDLALEPEVVQTFDRIDWFTHMVYRLSMPEKDWSDDRVRTVFAMPDTHLVLKMHHPQLAEIIDAVGEGYEEGKLARVNQMYYYQVEFLMGLNRQQGYSLFKTISIIEVLNNRANDTFSQHLVAFDSPAFEFGSVAERLVSTDESLLELLRYEDSQRF